MVLVPFGINVEEALGSCKGKRTADSSRAAARRFGMTCVAGWVAKVRCSAEKAGPSPAEKTRVRDDNLFLWASVYVAVETATHKASDTPARRATTKRPRLSFNRGRSSTDSRRHMAG
jgi:hypothetical protein